MLGIGSALAAPERTFLLREDQRPAAEGWEIGVKVDFSERQEGILGLSVTDEWENSAYIRYGMTPNLSLRATVPYLVRDPDLGSSDSGLGDVRLGFELVTWRDIYDYPYIMPYAEASFPTGDEDKGFGKGEIRGIAGIAGGSTAWRYTHFVVDVRYEIRPEADNRLSGGLAIIHELSKKFAVSVEGIVAEKEEGRSQRPKQIVAGMTYKPNPSWTLSFHGGKESDGERDAIGGLKIAYSFGNR